MADVAHNSPGPAPPKPGDVAQQQTSRADSPDRGKLRVFISYSRDDLDFADQLHAALNTYGFDSVIDRHGISGGEEWKRRLGNLISEADTVVFVLSPNSARSEICDWEVEQATRLGKRILPVICHPLEGESPPPRLRDLNYILFHADPKTPGAGFGTGLTKLVAALNTDFDWLREHTRYLQRATEWDRGGRPANRLLSGDDIAEAKAWAARRPKNAPEPTALQLDFIRASEEEAEARSSAQRKQLEAIAAAQDEREKALRQAEEALKQAAAAQGKRARNRNIAFVLVGFFVATFVLLVVALVSTYEAQRARDRGEEELAIRELAGAGRHAEALQLREASAARVEAAETRHAGKPGTATARVLRDVIRLALFTREFTKALSVADRAHVLFPDDLTIEINRAHALMFLGHEEESNALYLAHKGKPIGKDGQLWERVIAEDFVKFREAGLTPPMMAQIEKELGVSR